MTLLPQEIDDATFVFPGHICGTLLPDWDIIPDEFKQWGNDWSKIVSKWFYNGLGKESKFYPKKGIDPEKALRHIDTCLRSWEPKHEHKTAGVAYLLSLWFHKIKYQPYKDNDR